MYLDGKVEQAFQAELASRRQRQIVAAAGVRWKFRANLPLLEQPRCHWQRKARRIVPSVFSRGCVDQYPPTGRQGWCVGKPCRPWRRQELPGALSARPTQLFAVVRSLRFRPRSHRDDYVLALFVVVAAFHAELHRILLDAELRIPADWQQHGCLSSFRRIR